MTPLRHFCGDEYLEWQCYNAHKGNVGIFVGGGPSLNKLDTTKLTGPGKTVFGVNNTYPMVRPDIWVGMDDPKCYDRRVFLEGIPKIMRAGYQARTTEDGTKVKQFPNTYFASCEETKPKAELFDRFGKDTTKFIWKGNVMAITLNIMLYMGIRDIYLAGVDFDNTDSDYHTDQVLTDDLKDWNKNLYAQLYNYVQWLHLTGKRCGINIRSISPDSPINKIVPYVSLESLNQQLNVPEAGTLYHCKELE